MKNEIRFTHQFLVESSKSGDRTAQYQLYELYVDAMYNISMRFLGIKEDAEDIVQDSFVDAFRNLEKFKYESTFGAWLKRIVINKSINHLKVKRLPLATMDDHEFHLTEEVECEKVDAMEILKVKSGIEKLPIGYKQIINLYLLEGFDHNEISDVLGITTSTSKSQYHRAKKKLVEIINTL
ncbi:RNA polymerase sigma factor [Maribacter sp. 1_MG-2023]|uniref:RNA polymerase sigma factor n=1 Tax=Maribacter sp. 1_MG-2023 TaxID=3062677 RepID=UPI0026E12E7D|nr:RNA polymerase sigma factor [Maribacter sp. 1_MG-2023]MDO6473259.1 RNA polymerase sigma factor [Maribacter sp. 1_MG-2023]